MQSTRWLCVLVVAVFTGALSAKDQKPAGDPPGDVFFTAKASQPLALERIYPGIVAALQLTDDQRTAIWEAITKTIRSDDLRAAGAKAKGDGATADQREAAAKAQQDARKELAEVVAKTLAADQKALVARIQQSYDEARQEAMKALQDQFASAKGDQAKQADLKQQLATETKLEFGDRVNKILTPEQQKAVEAAAARQLEQEERSAKGKK